jgi:hypothetical protein
MQREAADRIGSALFERPSRSTRAIVFNSADALGLSAS